MPHARQSAAAHTFRALHTNPKGFIMPNAWDAGSAILLANEGFAAIATTSGGIAFSLGKQDYRVDDPRTGVTRAEMFARMAEIVAAVDVPVNGDLEAGFGDTPEAVAETVTMAVEAGLAGGNIEDKIPQQNALYDETLAVERIAAARTAAPKDRFVLTARTDVLARGGPIETAIRRADLFLKAGADCVFLPNSSDLKTVARLMKGIDGPLNVVIGLDSNNANAHDLIAAGVQRISLGGTIARATFALVRRAAHELRDHGSLSFAEGQLSHTDLNTAFAKRLAR